MIWNGNCGDTQFPLPQKVIRFHPNFDMDFVSRLMGASDEKHISASTRRRLILMKETVGKMIMPSLLYDVKKILSIDRGEITLADGVCLKSTKMGFAMRNANSVVIFLATVGPKLDLQIQKLMDQGKFADAYVSDALGSGAVESLADKFHKSFDQHIKDQGFQVGLRFSPGYCDWDVIEQQKLFSIIDGDSIGVKLNDTSLMTPRKSISALFGIYTKHQAPNIGSTNPCLQCNKKNCIARRKLKTIVQ